MVRSSFRRSFKYGKKISGTVIPGQSDRYTLSTGERIALEACVKTRPISPMMQIPYFAALEQMVKQSRHHNTDEIAIIINKWVMRGLNRRMLIDLAKCAGVGVPDCHYALDGNTLALWYFDEGTGTTTADQTGTYPLSFKGANEPLWTNDTHCGPFALRFDGNNDYLRNATLLDTCPDNGTIEMWIKRYTAWTPTSPGYQYIHYKRNTSGAGIRQWHVSLDGILGSVPGAIRWQLYDTVTGWQQVYSTTKTWLPHIWYHVAVTWGTHGMEIYINGIRESLNSFTGKLTTGTDADFYIGNVGPSTSAFDGTIDEVRVSNIRRSVFNLW